MGFICEIKKIVLFFFKKLIKLKVKKKKMETDNIVF